MLASAFVLEKPMDYRVPKINQDGLWKKVIADLFEDFLLFFAPELYKDVDFERVPDFLQQELFKEILADKKDTKYVDQIVKVHLKNGEEQWILVHIEIQGEDGEHFPERIFQYFYRIYDKYKRKIVAFAIMTGSENSEKSTTFNYSYYGTKIDYAYNVYKVKDYDKNELEKSTRLFSKVILAAKCLNDTKTDEAMRYMFKMKLMREVLKIENHPRQSIQAIFYFIDYLLQLPKELSKQLGETIRPILKKEENKMLQSEKWESSPTLGEAFEIERLKGEAKGILQSRREFALALLAEEFTAVRIAKLTGLSVAEVEDLRSVSEE